MNQEVPQPDDQDPLDAALDQLLSEACWPEPSAMDQARTRSQWAKISRRHHRQPALWCIGIVAVAAVIVLGVGVILKIIQSHPATPELVEIPAKTDVKYLMVTGTDTEPSKTVPSRPADLFERLAMFQSGATLSVRPDDPSPTRVGPGAPGRSQADAILARLEDESQRKTTLSSLQAMPNPPVDALLEKLESPNIEHRFAAAQALSAIDTPQVIAALCELAKDERTRREALAALRWCVNPLAKQALADMQLPAPAREQLEADRHLFDIQNRL